MEFFVALVVYPIGCKILEAMGAQGNIGPVCANLNISTSGNCTSSANYTSSRNYTSVSTSFTPPPSSEPRHPYATKEEKSNLIMEEDRKNQENWIHRLQQEQREERRRKELIRQEIIRQENLFKIFKEDDKIYEENISKRLKKINRKEAIFDHYYQEYKTNNNPFLRKWKNNELFNYYLEMDSQLEKDVKDFDKCYKNHVKELNYISHIPLVDTKLKKWREEEKRFLGEKREYSIKIYENIKKNINNLTVGLINTGSLVVNSYIDELCKITENNRRETEATVQIINNIVSTISNGIEETVSRHIENTQLHTEAMREIIAKVETTVSNAIVSVHGETMTRHLESSQIQREGTIQTVNTIIDVITSKPTQKLIIDSAEGVNSVYFEGASQIVKGFNPASLAMTATNDLLGKINNREKGVLESTGEAIATLTAGVVAGEIGLAIGGGLLAKTACETYYNFVTTNIHNALENISDNNEREEKAQVILDGINQIGMMSK